jgi:hypothetical protein
LRTRSTNLMRRATSHFCVAPSINKLYDDTTSATYAHTSFKSGTWSFDELKAARIDTSFRPHGRGHSSSTGCSDPGHTRSDTRTGESSPMHRTSNTYGHFTLDNYLILYISEKMSHALFICL